jgi:hypothetical protein
LPRSNVCSTRDLENPSASVHLKRFSTPSLTLKFLCAGKLNPRDHWRRISDDFIDIAASKTEELERKMNALPLIPVPEDDDEMTEDSAVPGAVAGSDTEDEDLDQEDA